MAYIAIVGHAAGRITKLQEYPTQAEAASHVATHGGFVAAKPAQGTDQDWLVDAGAQTLTFEQPDIPPAYPTLQAALLAMIAWIESLEAQITGPVSAGERESWTAKEAEARAWQDDNAALTPILTAEAAITGESMADLTTKVMVKANFTRPIMGDIAGLRRDLEAQLKAEAAKDDPNPANYELILANGQQRALQLATARGISL